jgi:hypothetical protein
MVDLTKISLLLLDFKELKILNTDKFSIKIIFTIT